MANSEGGRLSGRELAELVSDIGVHSSVYTSSEIFELELERIFYRRWVYVAHESEIEQPGDYVTRTVGRVPLIINRDASGTIHAFMNRCRHRGSTVCAELSGNAKFFRCPYHGWSYSSDGSLVGAAYPGIYGPEFDPAKLGLTEAPALDRYRGMIFIRLSESGPSLEDHLGPARDAIDPFMDASPAGEIVVRQGCHRTMYYGNWKFVGMDGYHTNFVHRSVQEIGSMLEQRAGGAEPNGRRAMGERPGRAAISATFTDKSEELTWSFGNGHVRLDLSQRRLAHVDDQIELLAKRPGGLDYVSEMEAVYGRTKAYQIIITQDPHIGIWPNLQIIGSHIRVIQPLSPDQTEVVLYPTFLKGAPDEINEARLRQHEWFYGPAGFGQPDDAEVFERNQIGLRANQEPWLFTARGVGTDKQVADGIWSGNITSELTQRTQMDAWATAMSETDA